MSGPRVVPLTCPHCGADLVGRAVDRIAFCAKDRTAWRVDGSSPRPIGISSVVDGESAEEAALALPFWLRLPWVMPAFASGRLLTLGRMTTRSMADWELQPGLGGLLPLGARLAPEMVSRMIHLVDAESTSADGPPHLLAVPVKRVENRLVLPSARWTVQLYPDDVLELDALAPRTDSAPAETATVS